MRVIGYQAHIRRIGEEKLDSFGEKTHPARRWVVERTLLAVQCRGLLGSTKRHPISWVFCNWPAGYYRRVWRLTVLR